jgi:hypothetical protein
MKSTTDFPRLLVATEFAPNSRGGGGSGAVMRQMLKEWPTEKLFWWSCLPSRDDFFGQKVASSRTAVIPQKLYPNRRWRGPKSWLLETFWVPWAAGHFKQTVEFFKPEAIWVLPHFWSIPPLARALPEIKTGFHVSIHDYMDIRGISNRIGIKRSRQLAAQADQLYARAFTRDAICGRMVEDLQARTGATGTINHAGLEQEDFDYLAGKPESPGGPIRIAYAGTIIAEDAFGLFAKALGQVRSRLPRPVTFDFFGDHSYRSRSWFDAGWMKEHGNLPAAELSRALKECSWGFAPMELTDENPRYNRFSLPTKFVSYIAAGLPIITLGHPESTVVKLTAQYPVGLSMAGGDVESLGARLMAGLSELNAKIKYRGEIQRCALAEFDARRMRAALYENFRKCGLMSQ